jgi:UDP-glucuronate 4-epimerase
MNIFITGGAGFIGSHACEHLLSLGHRVTTIDKFDSFYPKVRKRRNVAPLLKNENFKLVEGDYGDRLAVTKILKDGAFDVVLHLAAQAGVRPSIADPLMYERNNVGGLIAMLEAMKETGPRKIVAASSSSVYGNVTPAPFREDAPCMQPLSPYGASKRASEIFLGTYAGLYDFKINIVRPFTVYGPRQRPDMAIAGFTEKILQNEPITIFGDGSSSRDYTYVSDIVDGLTLALEKFPANFSIYNLAGASLVSLNELVAALERHTGKKASIQRSSMQRGDVERTSADISKAKNELGYAPKVNFEEGLARTVAWVRDELKAQAVSS